MKKILYLFIVLIVANVTPLRAQDNTTNETRYRRHSLCSMLIKHTEDQFADQIEQEFFKIPIDPRFNDHNLSVRLVNTDKKINYNNSVDKNIVGNKSSNTAGTEKSNKKKDKKKKKNDAEKNAWNDDVDNFVVNNNIGSRLVAKWFDRNILTGECDMELVKERGLYDASAFDYELAQNSKRGLAMLSDAGEDLIGNTYLLINDITYIDKGKRSRLFGGILGAALSIVGAATGVMNINDANKFGKNIADITASYKGFRVKVKTTLYRLNWDEEQSSDFYNNFYTEKADDYIRDNFEKNRDRFTMQYVGEVVSKGGTTSFAGIKEEEPELMIRKACQRALESNIADLQKKYEQFRIKAPLTTVSPEITVQIGMKEGVEPGSKYEVLEIVEKDGKTSYNRVAVIKAKGGKIWDNRFMAKEEGADGANLGATTFTKESGGDIYPGMLVRQIDK